MVLLKYWNIIWKKLEKNTMMKLFMILVLFWIDPGAGKVETDIYVKVWLDNGRPCSSIDDKLWSLQDQIIQGGLIRLNFTAFHKSYLRCECSVAYSPCYPNHTVNYTQLSLLYRLIRPSTNLNVLRPKKYINSTTYKPPSSNPTYFLCAEVTPTWAEHTECKPVTVNHQSQASTSSPSGPSASQASTSSSSSSGPGIGTIVGASLAGLAALAGLALAYPIYRQLKNRNKVDPDKDISLIIPSDFGITDAPNSVAPAGT
ncbi:hypothetical protein ACF0H5_007429 [Mactra antiquata]